VGSIKDVTFKKIQQEELKRYKEQLEELVRDRTKELVTVLNKLREEIEERKAKEKELEFTKQKVEAANILKSEFLEQMSHEIRTPINAIISYSSLLQVELEDKVDAEMKEAFQAISKAGDRIIRTVELILNMADLQTGSFEPHYQKWDVYNQILRRVFWEYAPKARSKGLALILEEPQGDTVTVADEFSLKHIFSNLIDNAIKYTDEGKVEIRTYRNENQKLVIEISDTGIGIDEEYLSSIFEPFSQEDHGYTRKFEGNGLGMALVKAYCDINNIDIKIETKKGVGTTFILTFTDPHGFEENNNQANQA
jgi:signal transduction histidine kinase